MLRILAVLLCFTPPLLGDVLHEYDGSVASPAPDPVSVGGGSWLAFDAVGTVAASGSSWEITDASSAGGSRYQYGQTITAPDVDALGGGWRLTVEVSVASGSGVFFGWGTGNDASINGQWNSHRWGVFLSVSGGDTVYNLDGTATNFTELGTGSHTLVFEDLDGDGDAALFIDGADVTGGETYTGRDGNSNANRLSFGAGSSGGTSASAWSLIALEALGAAQTTRFARVFDDHMVLQRGEPVAVFGTDNPGQAVTVTFAGQTKSATTDSAGKWRVDLDPLTASLTGRALTATGTSTNTLTDILVGEVWLAAGQSNMNWTVNQGSDAPHPANYPLLRMANWEGTVGVGSGTVYGPGDYAKLTPDNFYAGTWQTLDATTVLPQSAVAYFFANELAEALKGTGPGGSDIPVGIVDVAHGGTLTEAFIPPADHLPDPYLKSAFEDPRGARTTGQWAAGRITQNLTGYTHADPTIPHPHPFAPGFLYWAGMTHVVPFTFKGAIWYQGESNAEFTSGAYQWNGARLADYQYDVMKTLVESWRTAFNKPNLPFYEVQLPRISASNRALWPWYRDAQSRLAANLPGVEQAVITEFGVNGSNVHPGSKEPVGKRLARIARANEYGETLVVSGPVFTSQAIDGTTITLSFAHLGGGLVDNDGGALRNFEIAGADRAFVAATATIVGETTEVTAPGVECPQAVRYAWDMNVDVDFYNAAGLPASPFRTDDWAVAPGRPIRVACIGDSITAGVGVANPAQDSYPAQLAGLLGSTLFDVRGFGKSGAGVHRPANKYDASAEHTAALAFAPDIVICNLGINDITHWGTYTQADFMNEYRALVDAFAASGSDPLIIIWHRLAPLFPGQTFFGDPDVATLNEWIADVAALTGVLTLDMNTPLAGHPEWFPDNLHPNEAGARAIAGETFRFLRTLDQLDGLAIVSEFSANPDNSFPDADTDHPDWLELTSAGIAGIDVGGYYLTNDLANKTLWQIPAGTILAPGATLVIFASGKDRTTGELHTNFTLPDGGGTLALIEPDGTTVAHAYNPYPAQATGGTYGIPAEPANPATPVALQNPSFETYTSGIGTSNALPTDWAITDVAGVTPLRQAWTRAKTDGAYSYLISGTEARQTLTHNLLAGKSYTFRFSFAKGTASNVGTGGFYDIEIRAGGNLVAAFGNTVDPVNEITGNMDEQVLTFTTDAADPGIGSPIEILLRSDGAKYMGWDDLRLEFADPADPHKPLEVTPKFFPTPTPGAVNPTAGLSALEHWKDLYGIIDEQSDADLDGLAAIDEFVQGTNPLVASISPTTIATTPLPGGIHATIAFQIATGIPGLDYTLEESASLMLTSWLPSPSPLVTLSQINADGSTTLHLETSDPVVDLIDRLFFRVRYAYVELN